MDRHTDAPQFNAEIEALNVDDLDVEELEQRLEMAAAADCNCTWNDCGTYCTQPKTT
jgi:hypothetical protein